MIVDPNSGFPCSMPVVYGMVTVLSFLAALIAIPVVRKIALLSGFVDQPGGRKQHDGLIPPIGGIAIFLVFMTFLVLSQGVSVFLLMALALILVVGIVDDAHSVNAKFKFLIHFIAAFILVIGAGAQIYTLGNILGFGELNLGIFSIPFSVACVVYILNAVNMMDGVDGLAGGNSFLVFAWFAAAAFSAGHCMELGQLCALLAVLAAFLVFNMRSPFRRKASVFLGDAGSMALGLMIAWFSIQLSQGDAPVIHPISVAWIIALPIIDSFGLLVARLRDGKRPFDPDRRHFHHHFLAAGYSPQSTTPLILLWSGLLGAVGFMAPRLGVADAVLGWGWIALWWGHTVLVIKKDNFIRCLTAIRRKFSRDNQKLCG